jgi:hypothetical protein
MQNEIIKQAQAVAEERYPQNDIIDAFTHDAYKNLRKGFVAGVSWLLAHLQPRLETVWVWTKASEKLPEKEGIYNGRIKGRSATTVVFYKGHFYYEFDKGEPLKTGVVEWLEPTQIVAQESDVVGQKVLEFNKWLEENAQVIYGDKIVVYRYCDKMNEWGNYTLEDIYNEYINL